MTMEHPKAAAAVPATRTPAIREDGPQLERILRPRGIAVVGASQEPTKRGYQVVRALQNRGYEGNIQPVNPSGGVLLGLPVAPSVEAASGPVDLAVICTPAPTVPELIRACGRRGLAGAVVLAAGFRELGERGAALEAALTAAARESGVRVIGPNTSGILNLPLGLDLIGVPGTRPGRLALLAQSGNAALALLNDAVDRPGEGFSFVVGLGNESDLRFHEYLAFLGGAPEVGAVMVHAESFRDGEAFLRVARDVAPHLPVVVLKGGRTRAGDRAARSHTGAVASDHLVVRSALRQAGAVEVTRSDDLLPVARMLAGQPAARRGRGLAILADGGGQGTLAADTLEEAGVPLAELGEGTRTRLRELLGPNAALGNPVDFAGAADRDPSVFPQALELILADPEVAGVVVVGLFGGYAIRFAAELEGAEWTAAGELAGVARDAGKPLVVHSIYAESGSRAIRELVEAGVPVLRSVETACRAAAASWERGRHLEVLAGRGPASRGAGDVAPGAAAAPEPDPLEPARQEGRPALLETESRALLERWGVPLVTARFCTTGEEAVQALAELGGEVVVKAVSGTVLHKTEAGGVVVGCATPEAVESAYGSVRRGVEEWAGERGLDPDVRGVLVARRLPSPTVELLVGVRRDASFGHVLTVGAGGTAVEVLKDVAVRVLPVEPAEIREMLDELRIAPLLRGHRGRPPVDLEGLVRLIANLASAACAVPELEELELNPVFASPDSVVAVDARGYRSTAPEVAAG
ncbi:MAG: hypothetical protein EA422_07435 [Gemmatimonadales bacterium]|nr:MAG: hypothetical protein EA422_07435 [Gemmatimonadales bacterium]